MPSASWRRARPGLLVLLFLAAGLAGCVDDEAADEPAVVDDPTPPPVDNGTDLDEGLSIGHQPHVHDYWRGVDTVVLMEEGLQTAPVQENVFRGAFMSVARTVMQQEVPPDPLYEDPPLSWRLPDGVLVFEGTGALSFTFDFSGLTDQPESLRLFYRPADSREYQEFPEPILDGTDAVLNITYDMADIPHSLTSRWAFWVRPVHSSGIARLHGTLGVRIVGVKGFDVEMAPAHPDHWGNETVRDIMYDTRSFSYKRTLFQTEEVEMLVQLPEGAIVPPGTGQLEIWLEWTIGSSIPPIDHELSMLLRSAAQSRRGDFPEPDTEEAASKHFVVPVDLSMVDSPYANESAWEVDLFVMPRERAMQPLFMVEDVSGTWTLKIVAHRDPTWIPS